MYRQNHIICAFRDALISGGVCPETQVTLPHTLTQACSSFTGSETSHYDGASASKALLEWFSCSMSIADEEHSPCAHLD